MKYNDREISFRVWCIQDQRMYKKPIVTIDGRKVVFIGHAKNDYYVMEFTGYISKNRQKIFEGDIVKIKNKYFMVQWNENLLRFNLVNQYNGDRKELTKSCVKIGNVFEHPGYERYLNKD